MSGHYHYDCDEYCENCLPVDPNDPEVSLDDGEQDTPAHCSHCHRPLDYNLTTDGVDYVLEAIASAIEDGDYLSTEVVYTMPENPNYYYEGSPAYEVVYDWAKDLQGYGGLTKAQKVLIDLFVEMCDYTRNQTN